MHTTCCPGIGVIHVTPIHLGIFPNLDAPTPHRICHHMQMPTPLRSTSFGELRELNGKVIFLEFQGDKTHPSISCCMRVFVCFFVSSGFAYIYITEGGSNLKGTLMFPFLGDDKCGRNGLLGCGHVFVVTIHSLLLVGGGNSKILYFHPYNWEEKRILIDKNKTCFNML